MHMIRHEHKVSQIVTDTVEMPERLFNNVTKGRLAKQACSMTTIQLRMK